VADGLNPDARKLADLLRRSNSAVALTGAGVSVPSGIPDFRSPGTGLWEKVDPMEVAHIDAFHRDPQRFWQFYSQRFLALHDKRPNAAHAALAELERDGLLRGVITQNIDRLHRLAGSRRIVEVHGSIEQSLCVVCGRRVGLEEVMRLVSGGQTTPECEVCGAALKPDVVLFGELLPEEAIDDARALAADSDLMLCVGSSLEVYPIAALPSITQAAGGQIAVITQGPTPYDDEAAVKLEGDVVSSFEALKVALDT
jgi:NAD-dependent deacetylase